MALILPQTLPPPANPAAARLEATLASLPDDWTLLPRRRIGGADGPEIGFVLLHPEIGIALVDLLPARPDDGIEPLRDLIAADHAIADDDVLPVVAVALKPNEIADVGDRLAAAFDAAPVCDVADPAWPRRAIDLLLDAEDAAMSPLPPRQDQAIPREPMDADAADVCEAPFAADEPPLLSAPARRHVTFAAICAIVVAVIGAGGAAAYLLTEQPADTPVATAMSLPLPPPGPPAPPVAQPAPQTAQSAPPVAPAPAPQVAQTPAPQVASTPAPVPQAPAPITVAPRPAPQAPPPEANGLAAASPAPRPPAVADSTPPQAPTPIPADPALASAKPAPDQETAASPPSWAAAKPRPAKPAPAKAPKAAKPARKEIATAANQAPARAKQEAKRVASLEPRANAYAETPADAAPPPPQPTASPDAPPLDASDLPALEGSAAPPSNADLPLGAPVPLPVPFSGGAPASGMPVMLLPPVGPPAAMPNSPSVSANIGGLVGTPGGP